MPTERKDRGKISHSPTEYGKSVKGNPLEIYLPQDNSKINILLIAGIHGDEPESIVLLSEENCPLPNHFPSQTVSIFIVFKFKMKR